MTKEDLLILVRTTLMQSFWKRFWTFFFLVACVGLAPAFTVWDKGIVFFLMVWLTSPGLYALGMLTVGVRHTEMWIEKTYLEILESGASFEDSPTPST